MGGPRSRHHVTTCEPGLWCLPLTLTVSPWFLTLAGFVGANLLQASFTGFCPLALILRRAGVRPGALFQ